MLGYTYTTLLVPKSTARLVRMTESKLGKWIIQRQAVTVLSAIALVAILTAMIFLPFNQSIVNTAFITMGVLAVVNSVSFYITEFYHWSLKRRAQDIERALISMNFYED